jgi:ribosomal protein S18 acetylase RimI-like enzyme
MADRITTRAFVIDDYEQACALWNAADGIEVCEGDSREEIRAYLERNPGLSRVADAADVIAGAVLCGHDGRRGFIYHLAVAPDFRGRGVGKLLIADCLRGLRATGIQRAILLVAKDNSSGREFWLRNGWEELSEALPMTHET